MKRNASVYHKLFPEFFVSPKTCFTKQVVFVFWSYKTCLRNLVVFLSTYRSVFTEYIYCQCYLKFLVFMGHKINSFDFTLCYFVYYRGIFYSKIRYSLSLLIKRHRSRQTLANANKSHTCSSF